MSDHSGRCRLALQDVGEDRKREWDSERSRHEESFRDGNGAANGSGAANGGLPSAQLSPAASGPAEQALPGVAVHLQPAVSAETPEPAPAYGVIADGTPS